MNSFQIKLVAIITMLIDHIGLFFFPGIPIFRIIGRIAFPLFSFLIANGACHTKNIYGYLYRLFGFAVLSQIPYFLASGTITEPLNRLNVLFTLASGLLVIIVIKKYRNILIWLSTLILMSLLSLALNFDFGIVGILSVVGFYLFMEKTDILIFLQVCLFTLPMVFYSYYFYPRSVWQIMTENNYYAPFALLAFIFIFLFNKKEGPKIKYLFYFIYPLQYVVYYLIKIL